MMPISRRNFSLLAAALCGATLLPGPMSAQAGAPSPDLAGIAHVALRVKDLKASVTFYEKLGFVKAFDLSRDGKVYEAFIKINDRQFIELYPADAKNTQIGFLHLCFEGNDLNAVHDFYVSKGLTPNAVKTAGAGNLLFTMPGPITPQGPQNMEYTQYMPGSLHSKDVGLHLSEDRLSKRLIAVAIAANDPAAARSFYLDKAGFRALDGTAVGLPGTAVESLHLVPAADLGFKARMSFEVPDKVKSGDLEKRNFTPRELVNEGMLIDPDGNQIVLRVDAPPSPAKKKK